MIINFYGNQFVKLQVGDTVLALDPFKGVKFGADIVLQSTLNDDMSAGSDLFYGTKTPIIVKGPGEYEIKNVFIKGQNTYSNYDGIDNKSGTTYYTFEFDGIRILFLGAIDKSDKKISIEGDIDMVFIPISGDGRFSAKDAASFLKDIDCKAVIPMGFKETSEKCLQDFIKEIGGDEKTPVQDKLTIKKKELENLDQKLYIIKS
jgi:L-ascorbate metabolism protein UlaG (beta-lactamase superfamily)